MTTPDRTTDVLVVGGGACGLCAALLLGDLGVDALLVERHESTSILPKAHILNPVTMQIFDRAGIADEVYERGTPGEAFSQAGWYTSLAGDEPWEGQSIFRCPTWGGGELREAYAGWSPYPFGNLNQRLLEPLLRQHAEERASGRLLFGHELESWSQDDTGVQATILDRATGSRQRVHAQYLIGADGGRTIGPSLGVDLAGPEPFVDMISVHFRADLSSHIDNDRQLHLLFARPMLSGEVQLADIVAMGPDRWGRHSDEWHLLITLPLDAAVERAAYDATRGAADVRHHLGLPDLELDVLQISHWLIRSALAERYRVGRAFLVGDAAHRHPPNGGLGMNLGLQDVDNLVWKLAAVIKGVAGERLLDSYEAERRPVGGELMEWATFRFFSYMSATAGFGLVQGAPEAWNRDVLESLFSPTANGRGRRAFLESYYAPLAWEYGEADVELGYAYDDSPVVSPDGTPRPDRDPTGREHVPVARPGHRLPHAWLDLGGRRQSTQQLVRPDRFVLLVGADDGAWRAAAERVRAGLPVEVVSVGAAGDARDVDGRWAGLRGHDDRGALLVRPDGHVAYRALSAPTDHAGELRRALDVAVALTPAPDPTAPTTQTGA